MDQVLLALPSDERELLLIVREVKRSGFGDFYGTVAAKEIVTVKETYTHKLK